MTSPLEIASRRRSRRVDSVDDNAFLQIRKIALQGLILLNPDNFDSSQDLETHHW